jgi:hypothetical protein
MLAARLNQTYHYIRHMEDRDVAIQTAISTLKATIGAIPVIGAALNEYLFETRGRIKQDRINKFIESFAEYLTELKPVQLHINQIEKEEFGDFFEEIIIKVSKTKSEIKKEVFKKLLANQLTKPQDFDYASLLLDTIGSLHEGQIPILYKLNNEFYDSIADNQGQLFQKKKQLEKLRKERGRLFFNSSYREDSNNDPLVKNANAQVSALESEVYQLEDSLQNIIEDNNHEKIRKRNYRNPLLLHDLCNKGLAVDLSLKYEAEPFRFVKITRLGMDIIESLS